jgi:hypothetical protein
MMEIEVQRNHRLSDEFAGLDSKGDAEVGRVLEL